MIIQKNLVHDKLTEFFKLFLGSSVDSAMITLMEDEDSGYSNLYASYNAVSQYLKDFNPRSPFGLLSLHIPIMLSMKDGTLVELNEQDDNIGFFKHNRYECNFYMMNTEGNISQLL